MTLVVAEVVRTGRRRSAANPGDGGSPDVAGERRSAQCLAVVVGEHEAVGVRAWELPDVLSWTIHCELGERDRPV